MLFDYYACHNCVMLHNGCDDSDYAPEAVEAYTAGMDQFFPGGVTVRSLEPEFLDMSARCIICGSRETGDYYLVSY